MVLKSTAEKVFNSQLNLVDEKLGVLGFSTSNKNAIYMVLSAILNLGNIQFDGSTNDDSCCIKGDSRKFLYNAADLLQIDKSELEDVLTSYTRNIGNCQIK